MVDSGRDYDFIVIGSGFGGSVAAHRLTEKATASRSWKIGLPLERGGFPKPTAAHLALVLAGPRLALRGFFDMEFRHVVILHGCAVVAVRYLRRRHGGVAPRPPSRRLMGTAWLTGRRNAGLTSERRHPHVGDRKHASWPRRPFPRTGSRSGRSRPHLLPHQGRHLPGAGRRGPGETYT